MNYHLIDHLAGAEDTQSGCDIKQFSICPGFFDIFPSRPSESTDARKTFRNAVLFVGQLFFRISMWLFVSNLVERFISDCMYVECWMKISTFSR